MTGLRLELRCTSGIQSAMTDSQSTKQEIPCVDGLLSDFTADPIACMRRIQNEAGNLAALREGDQKVVFAFGADLNRQLLSRNDQFLSQFFAIRGPKNSAQRRLTTGLLSMNGQEHSQQRRFMKSIFEKRAIPGYVRMIGHHTQEMLRDWQPGQTRDISGEMISLMLKISSTMLFGMEDLELAFEIGEMMEYWVRLNHERGMSALISDEDFFPQYEHLLSFAEKLEKRVRKMISLRASQPDGHDVISLLLKARQAGAPISDSQLIGQTALVFAASHMTTAHTLTWTLLLLAQHPAVMQELLSELAESSKPKIGSDQSELAAGIMPTTVPSVLNRVIRESMRILPSSAYSQRVSNGATELNGVPLKPSSLVIFSQFITHRNEQLFPSASQFQPDRWNTIRPGSYEYLPFGGGARLCLGAQLAMSILHTALPMILSKIGLQVIPGTSINGRVISTMLSPESSIPMRLLQPGTVSETSSLTGNIHDLVTMPETVSRRAAA